MSYIIKATDLTKTYQRGSEEIHAINKASFSINRGDIVSVTGPSGSGKTTLVNILGCLDNPTSGSLIVNEREIFNSNNNLTEKELTRIRRDLFGYVFQKFFLIPTLTVSENIFLPSVFNKDISQNNDNLKSTLDMLGLDKRANHLPSQLSGGEMQRVAIARALISNPSVLIADEPTGNLDSKRSDEIRDLFLTLNKEQDLTVILVTHDNELAKIGNQRINILDGKIQ